MNKHEKAWSIPFDNPDLNLDQWRIALRKSMIKQSVG